jgi:hypothetical protein
MSAKPANARSRAGFSKVKSLDESPPPHDASISITKKFRFICQTACVDSAFTQTQLLDLLAQVNAATVAYRLNSAIRLRKVSIWAVPLSYASVSQAPTTVAVEFNNLGVAGSFGSPPRKYSDSSQNPADYAHIGVSPDPGSLSGSWFNDAATSPIMNIQCPVGAIVDLTLDLVMRNNETAVATRAISGGTVGDVCVLTMTSATAGAPGVLVSADYKGQT